MAKENPWAAVSAEMLKDRELTGTDIRVYAAIRSQANGSGTTAVSYTQTCNEFGLARRTLSRCLKRLDDRGWIVRERQTDEEGVAPTLYSFPRDPVGRDRRDTNPRDQRDTNRPRGRDESDTNVGTKRNRPRDEGDTNLGTGGTLSSIYTEELKEQPEKEPESAHPRATPPAHQGPPPKGGNSSAAELWDAAKQRLSHVIASPTYRQWIHPTRGIAFDGQRLLVQCPSAEAVEFLDRRLRSKLQAHVWEAELVFEGPS